MKSFSYGKLLISGEYLVLKGAVALAMPVKFGQSLEIFYDEFNGLKWESFEKGHLWFSAIFSPSNFEILHSTDLSIAQNLRKLLLEADKISGSNLPKINIKAISNADFNMQWGLGSSSSLIANVARWAGISPYDLHFRLSKGSGYDIACASSETPLFFQNKKGEINIEKAHFNPPFKDQIYFIYLGKKQDSAQSVNDFFRNENIDDAVIEEVSAISRELTQSDNLDTFEYYLEKHEHLISRVINKEMVKNTKFPDFTGKIKSLGAWGGDFAMATYKGSYKELVKYFSGKNLNVIFKFNEMIKQ